MNLEQHVTKAQHTWAFLSRMESMPGADQFDDWSTVVLFYSVLHLVDAFLHANGRDHGESHTERRLALARLVRSNRMAQTSLDLYNDLANVSRRRRYAEASVARRDCEDLVRENFRRIEAEVAGRLGLQAMPRLSFET